MKWLGTAFALTRSNKHVSSKSRTPSSQRLTEARNRGWMGEVEGLNISLASAEQKVASRALEKQERRGD